MTQVSSPQSTHLIEIARVLTRATQHLVEP
jgi:hypothetical protein